MNQENDTAIKIWADMAEYLPGMVLFALMAYIFDKLKFWKKKERVSVVTYKPATVVQYKKKRGYL